MIFRSASEYSAHHMVLVVESGIADDIWRKARHVSALTHGCEGNLCSDLRLAESTTVELMCDTWLGHRTDPGFVSLCS